MPTIVIRLKLISGRLARCRTLVRPTAPLRLHGWTWWRKFFPDSVLSPVISTRILQDFVRAFVWHAIHFFQNQIGRARSCRTSWRLHRPLHVFINILAEKGPSWGQFSFLRPFFNAKYPLLPLGSDFVELVWPPAIFLWCRQAETGLSIGKMSWNVKF